MFGESDAATWILKLDLVGHGGYYTGCDHFEMQAGIFKLQTIKRLQDSNLQLSRAMPKLLSLLVHICC